MGKTRSQRARRAAFGALPLLAAIVVLGSPSGSSAGDGAAASATTERPAAGADERPNVIVVMTDDQALASFTPEVMPVTFGRIVEKGTFFDNYVVATPLCCPSRAAMMTGQYGHNNGVLRNQYKRLLAPHNVLAAWLKRSGYRTMHVGRFLNGYGFEGRRDEAAPGWDTWRTMLEPFGYYDYKMRFDNHFRSYGKSDGAYITTNLNRIAERLILRKARGRRPFYLQLDHFAPHDGPGSRDERCAQTAVPAPADEDAFLDEKLPIGPAFDEEDISDKPDFFRYTVRIDEKKREFLRNSWQCTLASLREVDRGIAMITNALRKRGELANTAIIFASDNGYLFGEHRVLLDKHYPYEEALRVPLAIRLPEGYVGPGGQPAVSGASVANIDLAPTILDLTGAEPCKAVCRTLDGRSLFPLAAGLGDTIPDDRGIAIELDGNQPDKGLVCEYHGIRTGSDVLIDHTRARIVPRDPCAEIVAEDEYYDLGADPFQLTNTFGVPPGGPEGDRQAALAQRAAAIADCAGIRERDPLPPSGHYCE